MGPAWRLRPGSGQTQLVDVLEELAGRW